MTPSSTTLDSIRKILVLNRNHIGDCLLTTPTLRALKRRFSHAHLSVSVPYAHRDLLAANPYVDEIVPRPKMSRWLAKFQFALDVKDAGYDAIISFQEKSIFYALVSWHSNVPYTVSLRDGRTQSFYTETVPIEPDVHEVYKNLNVARHLGCPIEEPPVMELQTTPLARADINDLLSREGYDDDSRFIGINPGGTRSPKRWPVERLGQVAVKLQRETGLPILVFGGPTDRDLAEEAASHIPGEKVILAGRTSLGQAAAALERCRLFLTGDTGPMHMAVALAVPVVALFGPTNPVKFGPFSSQSVILRQDRPCAQCRDLCLHDITIDECLEVALRLYQGYPDRPAPIVVSH